MLTEIKVALVILLLGLLGYSYYWTYEQGQLSCAGKAANQTVQTIKNDVKKNKETQVKEFETTQKTIKSLENDKKKLNNDINILHKMLENNACRNVSLPANVIELLDSSTS